MGLGGPVWHASAAGSRGFHLGERALRDLAYAALEGVGDAWFGQWEEWTGYAFHVRRRLSDQEERTVGGVKDIRGTLEAQRRLRKVERYILASREARAIYLGELNKPAAAIAQTSHSFSIDDNTAAPVVDGGRTS